MKNLKISILFVTLLAASAVSFGWDEPGKDKKPDPTAAAAGGVDLRDEEGTKAPAASTAPAAGATTPAPTGTGGNTLTAKDGNFTLTIQIKEAEKAKAVAKLAEIDSAVTRLRTGRANIAARASAGGTDSGKYRRSLPIVDHRIDELVAESESLQGQIDGLQNQMDALKIHDAEQDKQISAALTAGTNAQTRADAAYGLAETANAGVLKVVPLVKKAQETGDAAIAANAKTNANVARITKIYDADFGQVRLWLPIVGIFSLLTVGYLIFKRFRP